MKILVADDHPLVRDALARVLEASRPGLSVVPVSDGAQLLARLAVEGFDVLLVDLGMPGLDGLELVRRLRQDWPQLPLIVVSGQVEPGLVRAVLEAGAAGFVPKTAGAETLLEALRLVQAGGIYVPPHAILQARDLAPAPPRGVTLTARQQDVLAALMNGAPNRSIAQALGLTEGTVKLHVAAVLRALQARNRTEAVVRARALGLCPRA